MANWDDIKLKPFALDESVFDYLTGDRVPASPALYVNCDKIVTVESKLSPHDDQLLIADLEQSDWSDDPEMTPADIARLINESIDEAILRWHDRDVRKPPAYEITVNGVVYVRKGY